MGQTGTVAHPERGVTPHVDGAGRRSGFVALVLLVACGSSFTLVAVLEWSGFEATSFAASGLTFALVGTVLAIRRPDNAMGLLFAGIGTLMATGSLAEVVSSGVFLDGRTGWRAGMLAAWWASWYWVPMLYGTYVLLPMLFPTGKPATGRWRMVVRVTLVVGLVATLGLMFGRDLVVDQGPTEVPVTLANPVGILPIAGASVVAPFATLAAVPLMLAGLLSLIQRYRGARPDERRQIAWGLAGLAATVVYLLVAAAVLRDRIGDGRSIVLDVLFTANIPVSMGIAVLRYRLYDIDRLIRRTASYSIVTVVLLAVYAGLVLLAQSVLGSGAPDVVVAGATLVVAALFRPVRLRVQSGVDRRFDRHRYDARVIVDAFGARLRDEIELAAFEDDLKGTVRDALAPASVVLWLPAVGTNEGRHREPEVVR